MNAACLLLCDLTTCPRTHDRPSTNALSRFDRDVLSVPGVKAVIVLLGINDIQYTHRYPAEAVRAPEEIAALKQLIDRAHDFDRPCRFPVCQCDRWPSPLRY